MYLNWFVNPPDAESLNSKLLPASAWSSVDVAGFTSEGLQRRVGSLPQQHYLLDLDTVTYSIYRSESVACGAHETAPESDTTSPAGSFELLLERSSLNVFFPCPPDTLIWAEYRFVTFAAGSMLSSMVSGLLLLSSTVIVYGTSTKSMEQCPLFQREA